MMTRQPHQDQQSRVLYELSAMILNLLRYPPTSIQFSDEIMFFLGFLLMPWVLGLVLLFYVAGVVSSISMSGRVFFLPYPISIFTKKRHP
ncbi:hypothetical protein Ccrd_010324 [Cynara cardunculus var. scolymus]|uniref:Uncharacterized protein n=1 Tax=Cynara cardunculus var. scolymus TaxID=59895 RepID=A0A124SI14_CYNCS|nr:hypothetical protein Ccrd_010324 [Cynara cardunculus var. scolymus]